MGRQWSSGTSRPGWNREAGPVPVPAVQRKPNVSHLATSRYAGKERVALAWQAAREILHTAEYSRMMQLSEPRWMSAHLAQFWLQWMTPREGLKLTEPAMRAYGSQEIEL